MVHAGNWICANKGHGSYDFWFNTMRGYLNAGSLKAWQCPTVTKTSTDGTGYYSINAMREGLRIAPLADISPRTPMLMEILGGFAANAWQIDNDTAYVVNTLHSNGANWLFADGHVAWLKTRAQHLGRYYFSSSSDPDFAGWSDGSDGASVW